MKTIIIKAIFLLLSIVFVITNHQYIQNFYAYLFGIPWFVINLFVVIDAIFEEVEKR